MIPQCRVLIAEDHRILREGLRALFASEPNVEVIAGVDDGADALHQCEEHLPDVVVMDVSMEHRIDPISRIKQRFPQIHVIVLTAESAEPCVHSALDAGAEAYLLKSDGYRELLMAIRSVLDGKIFLSPTICGGVVRGYLQRGKPASRSPVESLSHREREVITMVAEGLRNREIAGRLRLSIKTVEKHRASLMKKLSLRSAGAIAAFAFQHGIARP